MTLRFASTHALSFTFLPRWLRGLESQHHAGPGQLVSDVLQRCEALMLQSKVQFVLSHAHPQGARARWMRSHTVRRDRRGRPDPGVGARTRTASRATSSHGGRGSAVPVLQYTEESGLGRIMRAVVGRRLESVPAQIVFTAHLASVLRTMALDGRGIAWLPRTLVEEDIGQGRLVAAAGKEWDVPLEIRLYRDSELLGKAANAFWNTAIEE